MEILIVAALIGVIPAAIASSKGYSFALWWFFGATLFVVALPIALLMSPNLAAIERSKLCEGMKKCPFCAELVKVEARVCKHCGRDFPHPVSETPQSQDRAGIDGGVCAGRLSGEPLPPNFDERGLPLEIRCYQQLDTATHAAFKSAIVALLGDIGKDYASQPRVLPLVMLALMDYGSQQLRAAAIKAVEEIYRHSESGPPRNVLDVVLVHLRDTYVIVHRAALDALRSTSRWLTKPQALEALNGLWALLNAYRDDPFEMKDVCVVLLAVTRRFADLRQYAFRMVNSVFPTKQAMVDEDLLEAMGRYVEPSERAAEIVVHQAAWCLSQYSRDRYNSYEYCARANAFEWLFRIPQALYAATRAELLDAAQQLAAKDTWESLHFAALFSQFGDYPAEEVVLRAAAAALPAEQRYDSFRRELGNLATIAEANSRLCSGEVDSARRAMDAIQEIPDDAP